MIDRVACPLSCAKSNGSLRITRLWRTKPSSWKISLIGQRQWKALLKPSNATGNAEAAWLQQLVTEELRPRPGPHLSTHGVRQRGRRCMMAALHVDGSLVPVTLWVGLYASSSLMTASEGLALVLAYAAVLGASVLLAGIVVDVPWMLLPFFGLATALLTYALNKRQLVGAWFNVVVGFLDTFYLCVF